MSVAIERADDGTCHLTDDECGARNEQSGSFGCKPDEFRNLGIGACIGNCRPACVRIEPRCKGAGPGEFRRIERLRRSARHNPRPQVGPELRLGYGDTVNPHESALTGPPSTGVGGNDEQATHSSENPEFVNPVAPQCGVHLVGPVSGIPLEGGAGARCCLVSRHMARAEVDDLTVEHPVDRTITVPRGNHWLQTGVCAPRRCLHRPTAVVGSHEKPPCTHGSSSSERLHQTRYGQWRQPLLQQ
jgi:hypothetical protein